MQTWLVLTFSLKITATRAKTTSKSERGFSNLWIAGKYLFWPKFWISFPFNHIRFAAAACQPELWIAGKYFSLPTFIFVTTIFLQHCTGPTIFWNCVRTRLVLNDCFHQNHQHTLYMSYRLHIYFLSFISRSKLVASNIICTITGNVSWLPWSHRSLEEFSFSA